MVMTSQSSLIAALNPHYSSFGVVLSESFRTTAPIMKAEPHSGISSSL